MWTSQFGVYYFSSSKMVFYFLLCQRPMVNVLVFWYWYWSWSWLYNSDQIHRICQWYTWLSESQSCLGSKNDLSVKGPIPPTLPQWGHLLPGRSFVNIFTKFHKVSSNCLTVGRCGSLSIQSCPKWNLNCQFNQTFFAIEYFKEGEQLRGVWLGGSWVAAAQKTPGPAE